MMNGFMYGNIFEDEDRFQRQAVFPKLLCQNAEDFSYVSPEPLSARPSPPPASLPVSSLRSVWCHVYGAPALCQSWGDDKDSSNELRHALKPLGTSQEGGFEVAASTWFV